MDNQKERFRARLAEIRERFNHYGTASETAYAVIREGIRGGAIAPGARLIEVELAEALSMSRTPVHEALRRLEAERLIEHAPRGGLIVPAMTLDDLIEIFEIRELLEGLAARRGAERMSQTEIDVMGEAVKRMEQAMEANDVTAVSDASGQYHRILRSGARYSRLPQLLALLFDSQRSILAHEFGTPERMSAAIAEHRAIFEAIAARDSEEAEQLARQHSRNALRAQILAHSQ